MVRHYYVDQITDLSRRELRTVCETVEPPVCLLGGWAVHFHVNGGFEREHGRSYIGSRDIDLGFHVDPEWSQHEFRQTPLGRSIQRIQELGYTESRFGFVQNFDRDTGTRLSEHEASEYAMHEVFQVYVDIIPDTPALDAFEAAFGFRPPAEPLLKPAFDAGKTEPLSGRVAENMPEHVQLVTPELLAAMKLRSFPDRDKGHKEVKDLADLHALLWYVTDYADMKTGLTEYVTDEDIQRFEAAVTDQLLRETATLLQIEFDLIENSVNQLTW